MYTYDVRRWTSVTVLVVAAAAFALSIGGGRWWSVGDAFRVGPLGAQQCTPGDDCVPAAFWLDAGPRFERLAVATAAAGFVAMLVALALAGAFAAGRAPRLLWKMLIVALATAGVAAALWIAAFPGLPGAAVDRGMMLYGGGIVAAIVALVRTRSLLLKSA
jgi:hypothetical protein